MYSTNNAMPHIGVRKLVLAVVLAACGAGSATANELENAPRADSTVLAASTVDDSAVQEALLAHGAASVAPQDGSGDGDGGPPPGTKPPKSLGNGMVAGVKNADGSLTFYCKDALLGGFDWFTKLKGWFPSVLHTSAATTPTHQVVDMAYAKEGSMTFKNVVVPNSGTYRMTVRYAFASGLFPGVENRPMGVTVNGAPITENMSFPITGSFSKYQESTIQIPLNAGVNTVEIRAVNDHGISRADTVTID